jgi:hypothetical protein
VFWSSDPSLRISIYEGSRYNETFIFSIPGSIDEKPKTVEDSWTAWEKPALFHILWVYQVKDGEESFWGEGFGINLQPYLDKVLEVTGHTPANLPSIGEEAKADEQ